MQESVHQILTVPDFFFFFFRIFVLRKFEVHNAATKIFHFNSKYIFHKMDIISLFLEASIFCGIFVSFSNSSFNALSAI